MTGDLAAQLLRRGYLALPREHRDRGGADVFETSVLGRRAIVMRGRDGARMFYDPDVVEREGAVPAPLANLLFGRGAVHGTDGATHASRKRMFLDILDDGRVADLAATIGRDLERRVESWPGRTVVVFDEQPGSAGAPSNQAISSCSTCPAPTTTRPTGTKQNGSCRSASTR